MTPDDAFDSFVRDGYAVFSGLYAPALMQRWREAYRPLCEAASLPGRPPVSWLGDLLEAAPAHFTPLVAQPQLLAFAERVMGPFVQIDSTAFNLFPSVPTEAAAGRVNGWHRDRYAFVPQTRDYVRPWCINTLCYLQDLTADNGPLRVIPGSHRDPVVFSADERVRPHPRERLLAPRAGDVVVTHGLLAHSGTPNTGNGPRYFISTSLNMSWMKHRDALAGPRVQALIDDARERRDRRLLRLLGQDGQLWERSNPYFMADSDEARWAEWTAEDDSQLLRALEIDA